MTFPGADGRSAGATPLVHPFSVERRITSKMSLRDEGGVRHIIGHAAVFETLSEEMWGFREKIRRGAFLDSVVADDIRCLINHVPSHVLGRTRSGTLKVWEDETGLAYDCIPAETSYARNLMASLDRGDVDQSSFGFEALIDEWDFSGVCGVRTLVKVRVFDVSPVTFPAYKETDAGVRSFLGIDVAERRCAQARVDAGCPRPQDLVLVGRSAPKAEARSSARTVRNMRRRLDLAELAI